MSASTKCIASNAAVTHGASEELETGHGEVDDEACASEAGDTEAEEGEASAEDSAGFEDEANDASEAAVAGKELTEVIVGGVGTSGGHSGGRSSGGMTSVACWRPSPASEAVRDITE